MIAPKYEKLYDEFISFYERNHVCPWHEMSKEQTEELYYGYISTNDVFDKYAYYYMISYIIKRLSGKNDSHTTVQFAKNNWMPFFFKVIEGEVYVTGSKDKDVLLSKLVSINSIDIDRIRSEIEQITAYGTVGWLNNKIEQGLMNQETLLSLPSLQGSKSFSYEFVDENNNTINREYSVDSSDFKDVKYRRIIPAKHKNMYYELKDDTIILTYNSCVNELCEHIEEVLDELEYKLVLNHYNRIIVDIRNNTGGNSSNNLPILEFLKKHDELEIITLTNNRTFSSGRFMLMGLQNLGTVVIGEECGTPINCFGNKESKEISENRRRELNGRKPLENEFIHSCSTKYFYFDQDYELHQAVTKQEYEDMPNAWKVTDFQSPDIEMYQTLDDYKNNRDSVLEYALGYKKNKTR